MTTRNRTTLSPPFGRRLSNLLFTGSPFLSPTHGIWQSIFRETDGRRENHNNGWSKTKGVTVCVSAHTDISDRQRSTNGRLIPVEFSTHITVIRARPEYFLTPIFATGLISLIGACKNVWKNKFQPGRVHEELLS
jgi:hypothetical protein